MSLLTQTIASHPGATGDVLAAVAARTTGAAGRSTAAALLAHPNLPDDLAPALIATHPQLEDILGAHHLTDSARARILGHATLFDAAAHLNANANAHPSIATWVINHLHDVGNAHHTRPSTSGPMATPRNAFPTVGPIDETFLRVARPLRGRLIHLADHLAWAVVNHPNAHDNDKVAALRHLATTASQAATDTTPAGVAVHALVSHATRHPEHLRALANVATNAHVATALHRYADLHDNGGNARAARLDTLRQGNTRASDWSLYVRKTHDPLAAVEALIATFGATSVTRTIAAVPALRGTAAGHYLANPLRHQSTLRDLRNAAEDVSIAGLDALTDSHRDLLAGLDPDRRYTHMDDLTDLTTLYADQLTIDRLTPLSIVTAHDTPERIALAVNATQHPRPITGAYINYCARLAAHPNTDETARAQLTRPLRDYEDNPADETIATIATIAEATNPTGRTAALLNTNRTVANRTALREPPFASILTYHLRPALNDHITHARTITVVLDLETDFTGTLGELIDTATTIAADPTHD